MSRGILAYPSGHASERVRCGWQSAPARRKPNYYGGLCYPTWHESGRCRLMANRRPLRHFVWRCRGRGCQRHWPASSRASRFDTRCRSCETRNTIRWDSRKRAWWDDKRGRPRVTKYWLYDSFELARRDALATYLRQQSRTAFEGFRRANELMGVDLPAPEDEKDPQTPP